MWLPAQLDAAPDHSCIVMEAAVPVGPGQHNARSAVGSAFVITVEESAQRRFQFQNIEIISRNKGGNCEASL